MNKTSFLELLKSMSPHEINKLIEEKGKEPKKIKIFFVVK